MLFKDIFVSKKLKYPQNNKYSLSASTENGFIGWDN